MTRYLVTDTEIKNVIHEAMRAQDKYPQGYDYVIKSSMAKILACSYLTCAQRNNLMQIAKRLLDAARKAVM